MNRPGHNPALPSVADCVGCDHLNHGGPGEYCSEYKTLPDFKCEKNTLNLRYQALMAGVPATHEDPPG